MLFTLGTVALGVRAGRRPYALAHLRLTAAALAAGALWAQFLSAASGRLEDKLAPQLEAYAMTASLGLSAGVMLAQGPLETPPLVALRVYLGVLVASGSCSALGRGVVLLSIASDAMVFCTKILARTWRSAAAALLFVSTACATHAVVTVCVAPLSVRMVLETVAFGAYAVASAAYATVLDHFKRVDCLHGHDAPFVWTLHVKRS